MAPGSRLQELTAKYMQNPRRFFVPLANEYRKTNELDRAIALCREHLPAQPGHMSGHIVLARAYFEKGDVDAAREVFLTSVELDDENLIALRHLGDIARSRNELVEARQWYARVLDADPQNAEIERLLHAMESPESAAAEPIAATPFGDGIDSGSASQGGSALSDPTPPGLRAITTPDADGPLAGGAIAGAELPAVARPSLDRFDLSTLSAEPADALDALTADGGETIRVDDGVGFVFDDLDELVDPAAAGLNTGLTLPSVDEADFSAGIATPTEPHAIQPAAAPDELLSRPGFGALASFASWRSAQERETPTHVPAQPAPESPPAAPRVEAAGPADAESLFWQSESAETTSTAPEFVTETMAALYARQGFTQQALDVYRTLLARSPGDPHLAAKVAEMQAASPPPPGASLRQDADHALLFEEAAPGIADAAEEPSMLESMYEVSPPGDLETDFATGWDKSDAGADDWFADAPAPNLAPDAGFGGDELFGVSLEEFSSTAGASQPADHEGRAVATATLASVFGAPVITGADEVAGDMLLSLARQMVGRLPKEAPTLPVPDVLDLPAAAAGEEGTSTTPAPLLSFDRFFSGSGSPPRARIDTPAAARSTAPARQPAEPSPRPSLSPTFGGVPVIPPPPASVTPSSWASFDQFVPPVPASPEPSAPAAEPAPWSPPLSAPLPPTPPVPMAEAAPTSDPESVFTSPTSTPPSGTAPAAEPRADDEPAARSAPSEFHRWLEGLS